MRRGIRTILILATLLLPASCRQDVRAPAIEKTPTIRVRLFTNLSEARVAAAAQPPRVVAGGVERRLNFPASGDVPLTLTASGWQIGSLNLEGKDAELIIEPAVVGSVRVNGQLHRGRYRFVPVGEGKFDVVNDVDLDSYLMGVLAKEIPERWGEEAFKAQAVAARTYALYEAKTSGGKYWDVWADTRSQVYGGLGAETTKSRMAADATAGVVLAYGTTGRERIFKAYFSSCCGGIGQSARDALGDADIPPLAAKYVGTLCNISERFNWSQPVVLSKDELTRRIRAWGKRRDRPEKDMGKLAKIEIAESNRFNRPIRFQLTDERGARYSLTSEETRWACNADANGGPTLLSGFFKPIVEKDRIQFADGHGFGHGVGMCQWCTAAQAEKGMAHEDILRHAYPGAVLVRAY